jgi:hypothetical protein
LPEIAAGGRLVVDKGNIAPATAAYVALLRGDGELRIVKSDRANLSELPDDMKVAGKICAFLSSADPNPR